MTSRLLAGAGTLPRSFPRAPGLQLSDARAGRQTYSRIASGHSHHLTMPFRMQSAFDESRSHHATGLVLQPGVSMFPPTPVVQGCAESPRERRPTPADSTALAQPVARVCRSPPGRNSSRPPTENLGRALGALPPLKPGGGATVERA